MATVARTVTLRLTVTYQSNTDGAYIPCCCWGQYTIDPSGLSCRARSIKSANGLILVGLTDVSRWIADEGARRGATPIGIAGAQTRSPLAKLEDLAWP